MPPLISEMMVPRLPVALPVKLILRLALTIKYVWVTPWFNI